MKYNMHVDQCSLRLTNTLVNYIVSDIYVIHKYFSWCRPIFQMTHGIPICMLRAGTCINIIATVRHAQITPVHSVHR